MNSRVLTLDALPPVVQVLSLTMATMSRLYYRDFTRQPDRTGLSAEGQFEERIRIQMRNLLLIFIAYWHSIHKLSR